MERSLWIHSLLALAALLGFANGTKVVIVHWNDIGGQMESFVRGTSNSSAAPIPLPGEGGVGGLINLAHYINESIDNEDNTLTLTSGNLAGGESGWLPSVGWDSYGEFIKNHLKPDVMALGMKDFGAGVRRTIDFMDAIGSETVLANTCETSYSQNPEMDFCNKIAKLAIKSFETIKIGIIGFVTPTVERLSLPGKLAFSEVVKSVKAVADSDSSVDFFIALGDGNLDMAKEIIEKVNKVKVVIYGAGLSNTRDMTGSYPLEHKGGYIATAGRYGSSIGKLVLNVESGKVTVAPESKIIETERPSKLKDKGNEASADFQKTLNVAVAKDKEIEFAHSRVSLHGGERCWRDECNLGNLVTDAMVHCALIKPNVSKPFPYPLHSVWHGGALFEDTVNSSAPITKFDIHKWLPYHNRAHLVSTTGKNLRQLFEESAGGIDPEKAKKKDWRQFLQVSNGVEVYYATKKGAPVLSDVRMTHDKDGVPRVGDVINDNTYYLVIPTYLYEGRGVYDFATVEKGFWKDVTHDNVPSNFDFDDECVEGYVKAWKQISVGFEERIWIDGGDRHTDNCNCKTGRNTALTVFLTIVFFVLIVGIVYVGWFYVVPRLRRSGSTTVEYPRNQD